MTMHSSVASVKPQSFFSHRVQRASRLFAKRGRAAMAAVTLVSVGLGSLPAWAEDILVNINLATPEVLSEGLSGVGIAKAYRIVEYREAHGPFQAVEELAEVNGIGMSTVERNRPRIVLK